MLQSLDMNILVTRRVSGWLSHIVRQPLTVYLCLLCITGGGALLRMYKLGEWSFWGDEMFTVGGWEDGFNYSPLRKSLSSALVQMVIAMKGSNEWNARIVPAIFGILTIPLLYFIVKRLFDTPVAILSALLLALSPWHLYWSQNARFYTLAQTLAVELKANGS